MIITKKVKSKKSKKSSKKTSNPVSKKIPKESTFMRLYREDEEQKAKEKLEKEKAALAAEKEYYRKCKIIYQYMVKLDKRLNETIGGGFVSWTDDTNFKKIHMNRNEIEKITKANPKKYAGRHFAYITVKPFHKEHGEKRLMFDIDSWMTAFITIYEIKKDGTFERGGVRSANWVWLTDDFKITKFTFKFLEFMMHIVDKNIYSFAQPGGVSLQFIMNRLNEKKIDFGDVLQPLSGV